MWFDKKVLDKIIFSEIIFNKHIKLNKKIDGGDWLFFERENQLYILKVINSISEINIQTFNNIPSLYNILFFDKYNNNIYTIKDGFLKKHSSLQIQGNFEQITENDLYVPLEMPVNALETILDYVRVSNMLKEYMPLKVKIMHIKDRCYILYAENKTSDKNGYYSIDKRLIRDGLNLFHFVVDKNNELNDKNNILRSEIKLTKLQIKNNRYIIHKNEYKKIESN
jgi:hypothetical protein